MTTAQQHRGRAATAALVIAFLASGCGGGSTKASSPPSPQAISTTSVDAGQSTPATPSAGSGTDAGACDLLSEGDVTAAMRQAMKVSGDGGTICSYSATADPSALLYVNTFSSQSDMATDLQVESSSDHIAGLGDDAFWNSTLDLVFVRGGGRGLAVTSPSLASIVGDPQASKATMVGLARIALQKL
jgi:hypothetical protein